MAVYPIYQMIADMYDMGSEAITAGMAVKFGSGDDAGKIVKATAAHDTANGVFVLGMAGDSNTTTGPNTPYAAALKIGSNGSGSRYTQNRVSDMYNETLASGKITVFTGGGKFYTDQFTGTTSDLAVGKLVTAGSGGKWVATTVAAAVRGVVFSAPAAFDSGVPGTDVTAKGSMSLGTYVGIILLNN